MDNKSIAVLHRVLKNVNLSSQNTPASSHCAQRRWLPCHIRSYKDHGHQSHDSASAMRVKYQPFETMVLSRTSQFTMGSVQPSGRSWHPHSSGSLREDCHAKGKAEMQVGNPNHSPRLMPQRNQLSGRIASHQSKAMEASQSIPYAMSHYCYKTLSKSK